MKLFIICQSCAGEEVVSNNRSLRQNLALAGLGVVIQTDKEMNISQKLIILNILHSNAKKKKEIDGKERKEV